MKEKLTNYLLYTVGLTNARIVVHRREDLVAPSLYMSTLIDRAYTAEHR